MRTNQEKRVSSRSEDRSGLSGFSVENLGDADVLAVQDRHYYLDDVLLEQGFEHENGYVTATKTALKTIEVQNGWIVAVLDRPAVQNDGLPRYSARGALMLPAFRDMHIHLDKTFYGGPWRAPLPRKGVTIIDMIAREEELLPGLLPTSRQRAEALIDLLLSQGTTTARSHCNIDPVSGLKSLEHLLLALDTRRNAFACEIVAFPQHGLLRSGVVSLMREAVAMGVESIGGLDPTVVDDDMERSLDTMFQIALDHDKAVDIHLHEMTPSGMAAIHSMIETVEQTPELKNRLTISHAVALATLSPEELEDVAGRMVAQGISVASSVPMWPAYMPLPELRQFGVTVMGGTDSVIDHFSPFGTGDMLEKANFYAKLYRNGDEFGLSRSLSIATGGILPLADDGSPAWPAPGDPAEFVLVRCSCSAEAVARRSPRLAAFHKGRLAFGAVGKG